MKREASLMSVLSKAWQWVNWKVKAILGFFALLIPSLLFFIGDYSAVRDWVFLHVLAKRAPEHELTILISRFRSDPAGRYTSEVEAELHGEGWELVRFRRTLTAEELIESSRAKSVSELETVANLFQRHGGDVLITGEVSAVNDVVRVRIFDKGGSNPLDVEVDFRTEWMKVLAPYVEGAVLQGLVRAGASRFGEYDDEFLRRVLPIESKVMGLAERASAGPLHEDVRDVHRRLSIEIGYVLGDVSRLTSARQEIEKKLSNEDSFQTVDDRIVAMGNVANLSRVEALARGDARLLNLSFVLSSEIRKLLEVPDDDFLYPDDLEKNPEYKDTLEPESVVALACRDQQRIDELLKLYEQVAACRTDVMDPSCPMWSTRAIFALRYGRIAWTSSDILQLQAAAYVADSWARIGYGGCVRHWADPMTHADRLLRARLGIDSNAAVPFPTNAPSIPDDVPG